MLTIKYQTTFKKDYKRIKKRGYDVRKLEKVIELLATGQELPAEYSASCAIRYPDRHAPTPADPGIFFAYLFTLLTHFNT